MKDYLRQLRKKIKHDPIFMPTVGAIIFKDDEILLQKRKDFKNWAIHGGAIELGETPYEALVREVSEEIGITIEDAKFFKNYMGPEFQIIYPNKDHVYLVEFIYIVNKYDGSFIPQADEVCELKWFKFKDIPWDDLIDHNKIIIKDFLEYMKDNNNV